MSKSMYLMDYTGTDLVKGVNSMISSERVIQILRVSEFRSDNKTGMKHADYIIIYEVGHKENISVHREDG